MNIDGDDGLDGWNDSDAVEVGATNNPEAASKAAGDEGSDEKPKRPLTGAAKAAREAKEAREAAAAGADDQGGDEGDLDDGENGGNAGDEGGDENPRKKDANNRIKELTRHRRLAERENAALLARIEALEKGTGQTAAAADKVPVIGPAPDPTDTAKYPLGHLDDRYVDDKLEWLATNKAAQLAQESLDRQAQANSEQAAAARTQIIQNKIDDLADRGIDIDDDYHDKVVKTGLNGEWDLAEATFDACHEVDHGAQILYDLSQDKAEATRVAKLSVRQQIKYVDEKNDEIAAKKKPRTRSAAPAPAQTQTRGVGSKTKADPYSDDLDEFAKAWEQS